jgi:hypothetical protein
VESSLGGDRQAAADCAPLLDVVRVDQLERFAVEQRGVILRPASFGLLGRTHELLDCTRMVTSVSPVPRERSDCLA